MNPVQKAIKAGERMAEEKRIQQPDYEWLKVKHERKMKMRSYAVMARALDSLYENVHGESPWHK